jgi:hypothetical protein
MDKKCNNNEDYLFIKPIEYCSSNALYYLNLKNPSDNKYNIDITKIFKLDLTSDLTDLNKDFREDSTNNYKFKYEGNGGNNKNLCGQTNKIDEYYVNCVLQTNNPLFTYKDGYCIVSPDINLPPELKKIEDKNDIIIKLDRTNLEDEEGNFKYQQVQNNKYCEDRWYDWIVIPNYHLGNRVLKDSGAYSKEDVKICYNNCGARELPYINSSGKKLCVPKEIAYDGIYEKKLDYSPLALINLIGNNKNNLNLLYKNLFFYKLNKKTNTNKYSINTNVNLSEDLSNNDNYIVNEVFEEIKKILNNIVNDNNLNIPDYSFEYNHLTYKHPYFNENDLTTILGMDKNEILSNDIILIHTAYLAYNYYDFINNIKTNTIFFDIQNVANINKHDNHDFYITKVLIDYNSDFNLKKKRQRLANILYKAINICYDKKTDFSKNLIKRTKDALNRYDKSILLDSSKSIIFSNDKYENLKSKITDITNGFEIEYYKWNILKELYDKIEKGEFIKKSNENDNIIFKNLFQDKFVFYTEEDSEIINGNICKSGELLDSSNTCKSCSIECGTKEQCLSDNCKKFCETNCIVDKNETTNCGGTIEDDVVNQNQNQNQNKKEIKTPIEEETNIPDFTIIFKYAIKIFFILIVLYIAYMFYKIFNESILTFGNIFYGFFDWLFYLFSNNIKKAEHYENIIQDKYNTIIRKTMT